MQYKFINRNIWPWSQNNYHLLIAIFLLLFVFIINKQQSNIVINKQGPIIMLINAAFKYFNNSAFLLSSLFMKSVSTSKMEAYPIQDYEVGERLDRYLKKTPLGWVSGQKMLRKGDIIVKKPDGTFVDQGCYRFQANDVLMVSHVLKDKIGKNQLKQDRLIPRDEATRILQKMLIFDNQNIAILNKLPGYAVQGGPNPRMNIFSLMSSKYKKQMIYITHRLDRVTSGLVLVAKNKQTAQLVQVSMQQRTTFGKYYLALSSGNKPITNSGYIRSNIQWTNKNKARLCNQSQQNSKDCVTFYTPVQTRQHNIQKSQSFKYAQYSNSKIYNNLLALKLITGRKHQIRCHLSNYLQQPILNDTLYGGTRMPEFKQDDAVVFLHAFGLVIKSQEIIDKIKSGSRYLVNDKLGQMVQTERSIVFTANLPQYWNNKINTNINLHQLTKKIENLQKDSQHNTPKKRNITKIT